MKAIIAPMAGEMLVRSILASEGPGPVPVIVAWVNDKGAERKDNQENAQNKTGETSLL